MSTQTVFKVLGATSPSTDISLVQNAASTSPGDPILGLAFGTAGLTCYYRQAGTGTVTVISLVTQTVGGAYSSGGLVQVDSVHQPGQYKFDIPTVCCATAGEWNITFAGTPAGTVGNMETHTVKLFVGDVMGLLTQLPVESYAAIGAMPTLAQHIAMQNARMTPTNRYIVGTTETILKLDNVTVAATWSLNFAGNPNQYVRAS